MALRLVLVGRVRFLVVPVFCIGAKADTMSGEATKVVAARPAAAAANRVLRGMVRFAFCVGWDLVIVSEYGTIDWPPAVCSKKEFRLTFGTENMSRRFECRVTGDARLRKAGIEDATWVCVNL